MTNGYRPLFNRKYLTGLMWFCLIAILILTSMGPGEVEYHSIEHNKQKNIYWMELDEQPIILTILLPTPPALNTQQQQLQQLKSQIVKSILDSAPRAFSYSLTPRQDRVEISMGWASGQPAPDIKKLFAELQQPVHSEQWKTSLEKLQAREYIQSKTSEAQLINTFMQTLQPTQDIDPLQQLNQSYQSMFNSPRFAVSGEEAEEVSELLQALTENSDTSPVTTPATQPSGSNNIAAVDDKFHMLFGQTIAIRNSKEFLSQRLTAQVLQGLLKEYATQYGMEYRLLSTSLNDIGYRALILHGEQNPAAILGQLQQLVSEELVEQSQILLSQQWQERMRELRNQVQGLSLIAFYGLESDTLESHGEQLMDLDSDNIVAQAQQALQIDQQFSILQPPQQ